MQEVHNCIRWGIESVQFQEFFRTELVARSAKRGIPVPAIPIIPISDKSLRIERMQPHVNNGLIRFHASQTVLLEQIRQYPSADHDDGPDALEMLYSVAFSAGPSAGVTVPPSVANRRTSSGAMYGRQSNRMFGRR
jgi:predicted phage terminase large subunit-like protein